MANNTREQRKGSSVSMIEWHVVWTTPVIRIDFKIIVWRNTQTHEMNVKKWHVRRFSYCFEHICLFLSTTSCYVSSSLSLVQRELFVSLNSEFHFKRQLQISFEFLNIVQLFTFERVGTIKKEEEMNCKTLVDYWTFYWNNYSANQKDRNSYSSIKYWNKSNSTLNIFYIFLRIAIFHSETSQNCLNDK